MRKNMGLHRGKRTDNDEWINGYYVHLYDHKGNESHRIYPGYAETDCGDFYPDWFEVDPETVGQYTGHTDMKRKKIFEGDIIQRYKTEFNPPRKYKNPYVVHIKDEFPRTVEEYYSAFEHFTERIGYEVVGNIHDNPELLQEV